MIRSEREVVIIGAGPAGLQLGHHLHQQGRDYVVLERAAIPGSFFAQFPRHRKLISVNKVHTGYDDPERNMRWDWNSVLSEDGSPGLPAFSDEYFPDADVMLRYLSDYAERLVPNVEYQREVVAITRQGERFHLRCEDGVEYTCKQLVIATGMAQPYLPRIQGIEHAESYFDLDVDPERFTGKRVLILGKGNSAFETADGMIHKASLIHLVSPTCLKFAWNTHHPGHLRAINNNFLDTYQLKIQNAVLDANVTRLRKLDDGRISVSLAYSHARGEIEDIVYDHVIACTGFQMDARVFGEACRPARKHNNRFPDLTPEFESVNVPNLFFAGTLTQSLDFKKANSAFIHGFRYNVRALGQILAQRATGAPLPHHELRLDVRGLTTRILERVNRSSAMWQQFGFIGDAFVVSGGEVRHYEDLPVAYIHHSEIGQSEHYYVVTLEFGDHHGDVFSVVRDPDVDSAERSFFLHPVIRLYSKGILVRRLHLLENLFGEWQHRQLHERPLLEFVGQTLYPADALLRAVERGQQDA